MEIVQTNWLVFVVAAVAVLLVAWLLLRRGSSRPDRAYRPDVLDEGAAPAARNQALIDAPPIAVTETIVPAAFSVGLGGLGEAIAVAAQDNVEEAEAATPMTEPAASPVSAPSAPAQRDDLARIKGLGPKLQALLPTLGITTFAQIAALDQAGLAELDSRLGAFAGRPARDGWVEQAGYLAAGDLTGFEARFGKV